MLEFNSVNQAFHDFVLNLKEGRTSATERQSRNGKVLQFDEPVTICFKSPRNRVLFNQTRDCNPFFHLFEAFWMLAGRNDVAALDLYNSKMKDFSDDGETFNGAYGYRWRHAALPDDSYRSGETLVDQLDLIVEHLRSNPDSRRAVLQMWNVEDDLLKIDSSKDVCCNTQVMFSIREQSKGSGLPDSTIPVRCLDMHVINRSNDLIWGLLGANVVHFSYLLEYMANRIGVEVGRQYHTSNNLHVYTENNSGFDADALLDDDYCGDFGHEVVEHNPKPMDAILDEDLELFMRTNTTGPPSEDEYVSDYLTTVVQPAMDAFRFHKKRLYYHARISLEQIECPDWKFACTNWIDKRERNWRKNND